MAQFFQPPADWKFADSHVAMVDKDGKVHAIYHIHPKRRELIKPIKVLS